MLRLKRNNHIEKKLDDLVLEAVADYRPRPYSGRVVFFAAASRPDGDAWDFSQGWRELVRKKFEVYHIPGDHRSMFSKNNVACIATKLTKCCAVFQYMLMTLFNNDLFQLDLLSSL